VELIKTIQQINKAYGPGSIRLGTEIPDVNRVTTGSILLDWGMGGGVPLGRVIEYMGYESSGKSLLALVQAKIFQEVFPDKAVAWIDAEGVWDVSWVERVGVSSEKIWLSQPDSLNKTFNIMEGLIRSGKVSLIVNDSLGIASPTAEVEKDMKVPLPGKKAITVNQGNRKIQAALNYISSKGKLTPAIINLNHIYLDLSGFHPRKVSPGG